MSAYRVEVQIFSGEWVSWGVVRAKDALQAIRQTLRSNPLGVTAVRVVREYKEVNCEA